MALTEWSLQGSEFTNCNCNWGCPCQFNSAPSHGDCRAHTFIQIDKGHYGDISLDGLRFGALLAWPGPIHLGNGTVRRIIDERANEKQRMALEAIASGEQSDPGSLILQVFAATFSTVLPTLFKPIDLEINIPERRARLIVPDVIAGTAEPIRNPVTGEPQRVRVTLPAGFEFTEAEFASGKAIATAPIELDFNGTHAHLARIHWTTHGVVRPN
jgi:hypothetical protein